MMGMMGDQRTTDIGAESCRLQSGAVSWKVGPNRGFPCRFFFFLTLLLMDRPFPDPFPRTRKFSADNGYHLLVYTERRATIMRTLPYV